MSTLEMWQQAMQPNELDILCMDNVDVYRQWVSEVEDDQCPFCGGEVVTMKAVVCGNPACIFKTVTYSVLMEFGQEAG
ncbi:MAG: hypothetical protein KDJ52_07490 [Anaerolineae bacterium]|nr:hypothetical protein [Anaerolineae bacterium]